MMLLLLCVVTTDYLIGMRAVIRHEVHTFSSNFWLVLIAFWQSYNPFSAKT